MAKSSGEVSRKKLTPMIASAVKRWSNAGQTQVKTLVYTSQEHWSNTMVKRHCRTRRCSRPPDPVPITPRRPKTTQTLVKHWSNTGQALVRCRSNSGQKVVKRSVLTIGRDPQMQVKMPMMRKELRVITDTGHR